MCRRSNSFLQSGLPIGDDDELGAIVLTSGDRQDAAIFGYVHGEALANRGFNQSRNLACFACDQVRALFVDFGDLETAIVADV